MMVTIPTTPVGGNKKDIWRRGGGGLVGGGNCSFWSRNRRGGLNIASDNYCVSVYPLKYEEQNFLKQNNQ